jgi:hypothetical protein
MRTHIPHTRRPNGLRSVYSTAGAPHPRVWGRGLSPGAPTPAPAELEIQNHQIALGFAAADDAFSWSYRPNCRREESASFRTILHFRLGPTGGGSEPHTTVGPLPASTIGSAHTLPAYPHRQLPLYATPHTLRRFNHCRVTRTRPVGPSSLGGHIVFFCVYSVVVSNVCCPFSSSFSKGGRTTTHDDRLRGSCFSSCQATSPKPTAPHGTKTASS